VRRDPPHYAARVSRIITEHEFLAEDDTYLGAIGNGETFIITRNGVPIAEAVPVAGKTGDRSLSAALRRAVRYLSRRLPVDRRR
jgi:hypothetical protein